MQTVKLASLLRVINQRVHSERTVGAALRGCPCAKFKRGAATEGRPYSTFPADTMYYALIEG